MTLLVIGATGLLGGAVMAAAASRGQAAVGAARSGADLALDVTDLAALERTLDAADPAVVVNACALVDLAACEAHPGAAYAVNARPVAVLARWCRARDRHLVQVSTDHFFTGGGDRRHGEDAPVTLVNEYARGKFAAEGFARTHAGSLVVRTNFSGRRRHPGPATFFEWAAGALAGDGPVRGFDDYVTSMLDVDTLARSLLDLVGLGATGLVNLGSRTPCSKYAFLRALAEEMGLAERPVEQASMGVLTPPRAESLGLDVSRAESLLGRTLPEPREVTRRMVAAARQEAA